MEKNSPFILGTGDGFFKDAIMIGEIKSFNSLRIKTYAKYSVDVGYVIVAFKEKLQKFSVDKKMKDEFKLEEQIDFIDLPPKQLQRELSLEFISSRAGEIEEVQVLSTHRTLRTLKIVPHERIHIGMDVNVLNDGFQFSCKVINKETLLLNNPTTKQLERQINNYFTA